MQYFSPLRTGVWIFVIFMHMFAAGRADGGAPLSHRYLACTHDQPPTAAEASDQPITAQVGVTQPTTFDQIRGWEHVYKCQTHFD
jgi:hypothetical protein